TDPRGRQSRSQDTHAPDPAGPPWKGDESLLAERLAIGSEGAGGLPAALVVGVGQTGHAVDVRLRLVVHPEVILGGLAVAVVVSVAHAGDAETARGSPSVGAE